MMVMIVKDVIMKLVHQ